MVRCPKCRVTPGFTAWQQSVWQQSVPGPCLRLATGLSNPGLTYSPGLHPPQVSAAATTFPRLRASAGAELQKKINTKKPPFWVAFSSTNKKLNFHLLVGRMFYLASSYFRRGLPPNYCRRCCVSRPSSRWIGVGPQRHGHQDRHPQVNPENCIG